MVVNSISAVSAVAMQIRGDEMIIVRGISEPFQSESRRLVEY